MHAIGIDIGTTTIKGAVLDLESRQVRTQASLPFPKSTPQADRGRDEVPMPAVLEAVDHLLAAFLQATPNVADVFLCGQMHGIAVLDEHQRALTPFVTWRDQRVLSMAPPGSSPEPSLFDACRAGLTADEIRVTGNELRPGLGSLSLAALQEERSLPDQSMVLPICDAIAATWSGSEPVLHPTYAASLGAFDLGESDWSWAVLRRWGIDRFWWPKVLKLEAGSAVNPVYECRRHGKSLRIYPAIGDHQAALLGVGLREGELSLNVSTGAQLASLSDGFQPGNYQSRPYFDGLGLNTVSHLPAGQELNVLVGLLTEIPGENEVCRSDPWPYIHRQVSEVLETDLEIDLAFASGGSLERLRTGNLRVGHLFRAAFREMASQYKIHAAPLSLGPAWDRLVVSGGLALRSEGLLQEIQKAFGSEVRLADSGGEDTLQGLLAWARRCLYGERMGNAFSEDSCG